MRCIGTTWTRDASGHPLACTVRSFRLEKKTSGKNRLSMSAPEIHDQDFEQVDPQPIPHESDPESESSDSDDGQPQVTALSISIRDLQTIGMDMLWTVTGSTDTFIPVPGHPVQITRPGLHGSTTKALMANTLSQLRDIFMEGNGVFREVVEDYTGSEHLESGTRYTFGRFIDAAVLVHALLMVKYPHPARHPQATTRSTRELLSDKYPDGCAETHDDLTPDEHTLHLALDTWIRAFRALWDFCRDPIELEEPPNEPREGGSAARAGSNKGQGKGAAY